MPSPIIPQPQPSRKRSLTEYDAETLRLRIYHAHVGRHWPCWLVGHNWRKEVIGIYLYIGTPQERQCDVAVCTRCPKAKVSYGDYPPRMWPRPGGNERPTYARPAAPPPPWPGLPETSLRVPMPEVQPPKGEIMQSFKKEMGAEVRLDLTQETGHVIGRAEYDHSENAYLVRYVTADGRQSESWWAESAIA